MDLNGTELSDIFPSWFWTVGIVLAVGCAGLLVLYYLEHPGQSPWTDFARIRIPDDVSSLVDQASGEGHGPVEGLA